MSIKVVFIYLMVFCTTMIQWWVKTYNNCVFHNHVESRCVSCLMISITRATKRQKKKSARVSIGRKWVMISNSIWVRVKTVKKARALVTDRTPVAAIPRDTIPFSHLYMDVIGPLFDKAELIYCLVLTVDVRGFRLLSLWGILTTKAVCDALIQVFSFVGVSSVIISSHSPIYCHLNLTFSKAFNTVHHSSLLHKLAHLDLPDHIYNWLSDFFYNHSHCTLFYDQQSSLLDITARDSPSDLPPMSLQQEISPQLFLEILYVNLLTILIWLYQPTM